MYIISIQHILSKKIFLTDFGSALDCLYIQYNENNALFTTMAPIQYKSRTAHTVHKTQFTLLMLEAGQKKQEEPARQRNFLTV